MRALAAVEARSTELRAVRWFVVVFFLLLDTLVIKLKSVGRAERSAIAAWTEVVPLQRDLRLVNKYFLSTGQRPIRAVVRSSICHKLASTRGAPA
jgi:hypothetical protein